MVTSTTNTADRFARGVAYAVNPFVLPPLLLVAILALHDAPPAEIVIAAGLCVIFLALVPIAVIRWMVGTGRTASIEVLDRKARSAPYLAGFLGTAIALAGLLAFVQTARTLVLAVAALLCFNTALLALINLRWKISLHAAGAAGFVTILVFASSLTASGWSAILPAAVLVPIVMWARLRTRAHTAGEVWAGAAFGIAVPLLELTTLVAAGHL